MTISRPEGLPDFERPPLDELTLGIQFADVPFKNHHAGILWQRFMAEYPNVEEQPTVPPVFETFGAPQAVPDIAQFQLMMRPDVLRYWFVSQDESQLLQVQPDRVIHNWRRRRVEDAYPRYESVRARLENEIEKVQTFFGEQGWGDIRANQCEVTYINIIGPSEASDNPNRDLAEIFSFWAERYSDEYLSQIERGQFNVSFLIEGEPGGDPTGRLHVSTQPVLRRSDSALAMRLNITARGRPNGETIAAGLQWLDRGRIAVVRGFTSLTTQKMHKIWGRKDTK
jgi:uncharacterized protein (TIGR04255 family)